MRIIEMTIEGKSRTDEFYIYPIGDTHVGKINCHESGIKKVVREVESRDNALWFGGGDYCDCIKPQDAKRFSPDTLPNWLLTGNPDTIRENLSDIVSKQAHRFTRFVEPIKDKCIGMISGNHEATMLKSYNYDVHKTLCAWLGVQDLTDTFFMRLRFKRSQSGGVKTITLFATHGSGGGRTPGAEPNHLARLIQDKDADILFRGHSHTQCIPTETPMLYIPHNGKLPVRECRQKLKYSANWGAYVKTYAVGPPTYDSRAQYPARALKTCYAKIRPFVNANEPEIEILPFNL